MKCSNCGDKGSHYVPPSMGEGGFWLCDTVTILKERLADLRAALKEAQTLAAAQKVVEDAGMVCVPTSVDTGHPLYGWDQWKIDIFDAMVKNIEKNRARAAAESGGG